MNSQRTNTTATNSIRLYEVSVIRPIIILSLVINHAFDKIASGGGHINDFILPCAYQWANWFNFEATLEIFVLISGYLFAFQCITLARNYPFHVYALKKAHRLLLPMLVFGVFYYFFFFFNKESFTISDFIMKLLNGCGHLWFLPMLFWCLILLWVIVAFHIDGKITLVCLACLSVIKYLPLPFGLSQIPHYLFYAFWGYYLYKNKEVVLAAFKRREWILPMLWLLYFMFVWLKHSQYIQTLICDVFLYKGVIYISNGLIELFACLSGIFALYGTVSLITMKESFEMSPFIKKADKVSFGIYLYHQFILVALYHYTSIVFHVNEWLLPWIGFSIAITISWLLTSLTLYTRFGKFLLG